MGITDMGITDRGITQRVRLVAMSAAFAVLSSSCFWVGHVSLTTAGGQASSTVSPLDVSVDGRYVLLWTTAALAPGDGNGVGDLYRRDMLTGTTIRVSVSTTGGDLDAPTPFDGEMSDNGDRVVFASPATNAVAGDVNGRIDIFVRYVTANTTVLASRTSAGMAANGDSSTPAISGDGTVVAYTSAATNLAVDANGVTDIFRFDLISGTTTRVSTDGSGTEANGWSSHPSVDGDGDLIAFESTATNLVAGDTNGENDVFVKLTSGYIERASVSSAGGEGNGRSDRPSISSSGSRVAFRTTADNLVAGDSDGNDDVLVRDVALAVTVNASAHTTNDATPPSLDGGGNAVAFTDSTASAHVYEVDTATWHIGSVGQTGLPVDGHQPHLSADGRYLAFRTPTNVLATDTNALPDVYLVAHREPAPVSFAPATATRGTGTAVTVTGTGFESGAKVFDLTGVVTFINVTVVSSTTITATALIGPGAPLGERWIDVQNPDGGPGVDSGSLGACKCLTIVS